MKACSRIIVQIYACWILEYCEHQWFQQYKRIYKPMYRSTTNWYANWQPKQSASSSSNWWVNYHTHTDWKSDPFSNLHRKQMHKTASTFSHILTQQVVKLLIGQRYSTCSTLANGAQQRHKTAHCMQIGTQHGSFVDYQLKITSARSTNFGQRKL